MSKFFTAGKAKFFKAGNLNPECPNCGSSSETGGGSGSQVSMSIAGSDSLLVSADRLLDSLVINASAATTFSVGTTPGGSEIGSLAVSAGVDETLTVHYFIPAGTTIHFTLGSGTATLKLYFD